MAVAGGSDGWEGGESGNTHQVLLPPGLARSCRHHPGGAVSQVLKGRDRVGLRSRGRWSPSSEGWERNGGELGNAEEGVCASDFIHSLRETFPRAAKGR